VAVEEDMSVEEDAAVTEQDAAATEQDGATAEQAGLSAEQIDEARVLFNSWSCGACHVMSDANGTGHIGPSLDGNNAMDKDFIVARVTNGQGAMPGFGGQMSDEEIELVSVYIMEAKK
jgi:mono/diheme cytochrome c family protein